MLMIIGGVVIRGGEGVMLVLGLDLITVGRTEHIRITRIGDFTFFVKDSHDHRVCAQRMTVLPIET